MGGCTNSKYAVDEDKQTKKEKKPFSLKKSKNKNKEPVNNANGEQQQQPQQQQETEKQVVVDTTNHVGETKAQHPEGETPATPSPAPKVEKEDIEFIDREDAEKQAAAAAAAAAAAGASTTVTSNSEDGKKEVTTYQTTVVKHTQKEGDELLQHLKDEAFKQLQSSLKQQASNQNRTQTTTASSSTNQTPETSSDDSSQDLLQQIKAQVLSSLGKTNENSINSILDTGAGLIKDNKVKNMNELEDELNKAHSNNADLVKKVINSTTGFLTAKGTEAGVILSNILANVNNSGIQGIMNETEKTTVKVTRTVTEQIMSGGQLKEITRIITTNEPVGSGSSSSTSPPNLDDILKNLSSDSKIIKTGTTVTSVNTTVNETHEDVDNTSSKTEDEELKDKAEEVVTKVVNAAVEKLIDETNEESKHNTSNVNSNVNETSQSHNGVKVDQDENVTTTNNLTNGFHQDDQVVEENIKIEEESTVKTSTTKIVLNGTSNGLDQIQSEFYKHGKQAAEEVVKKLNESVTEENTTTTTTTINNNNLNNTNLNETTTTTTTPSTNEASSSN